MMQDVLTFVEEQLELAAVYGRNSQYGRGYLTALEEMEEYIQDLMWQEGDAE